MTSFFCKHTSRPGGTWLLALIMMLPLVCGCSGASIPSPDPPSSGSSPAFTVIDLRIGVGETSGPPLSRAFPDSEDSSFENPASRYETVHTLRVVIVRPDNTIEHNRMVTVRTGYPDLIDSSWIVNDNLRFKVIAGEKKKIYLFANEKAVLTEAAPDGAFSFSESLAPGKQFPYDDVDNITVSRTPGLPAVDNSPDDGHAMGVYLPMSEMFDITVPPASGNGEDFLTETLFLTRSLIKFSFSIKYAVGEDGAASGGNSPGISLRGVRISNLADRSYYLPRDTRYSPEKYSASPDPSGGREIISFEVPASPGESSCTFPFGEMGIKAGESMTASPCIYLPESKTSGEYLLSLLFTDSGQDNLWEAKPLQIKDIARNTHVKVNITLTAHRIESATVTLYPYTGVNLNPSFGF